jgi:kinesin family member 2/24
LCIREDGNQQVCIVGLQEYNVSDIETVEKLVRKGNAARSKGTSSTGAKEESSRSHSVLQLAIKQNPVCPSNVTKRKSETGETKAKGAKVIGKISFIDLAGSEHGADRTHGDNDMRFALKKPLIFLNMIMSISID